MYVVCNGLHSLENYWFHRGICFGQSSNSTLEKYILGTLSFHNISRKSGKKNEKIQRLLVQGNRDKKVPTKTNIERRKQKNHLIKWM